MRVIGDASATIEKRVICTNCGSEIGYLPVDVLTENHKDYTGSTDTVESIKCPKCQEKITV